MTTSTPEQTSTLVSPTVPGSGAEHDIQALLRVELDANLGHLVENIEVDSYWLARLMASKGVSGSDIAETTMHISADTVVEGDPTSGDTLVQGGHHDSPTKTVQINIGSVMAEVDYIKTQYEAANGHAEEGKVDEVGSILASEKAVHELSHRIDDALGRNTFEEKLAYYDDVMSEKFIGKALRKVLRANRKSGNHETTAGLLRKLVIGTIMVNNSDHERYANSPEEQRADVLSEEAVKQFDKEGKYPIAITFKKPFPQTVR